METKGIDILGGFLGVVFLIFLTLKLAQVGEVADWSWWWVTAPLWLPLSALIGVVLLVIVLVTPIAWFVERRRVGRARKHNAKVRAQ